MIKKFIFPLIAILLLTSCANKFSLQKRKYTKGFYFATGKDNSKKDQGTRISHTKIKPVAEVANEEVVLATTIKPEVKNEPVLLSPKAIETKPAHRDSKKSPVTASANRKAAQHEKTFKNVETVINESESSSTNSSPSAKKGESGAKLVVMIILCFFPIINLIPVYIHDNGITLNFWITLLLCLTVIGSIIFSLLVVLDVVDLA